MDPNAALKELRQLAAKDWTGKDTEELDAAEISRMHDDIIRMCDLFQGLDHWLSRGGFLPKGWSK